MICQVDFGDHDQYANWQARGLKEGVEQEDVENDGGKKYQRQLYPKTNEEHDAAGKFDNFHKVEQITRTNEGTYKSTRLFVGFHGRQKGYKKVDAKKGENEALYDACDHWDFTHGVSPSCGGCPAGDT